MASTKHYVVLAVLKAAGCCGSQPVSLGHASSPETLAQCRPSSIYTLHKPGTPNTILKSFIPWHCCTSGKMRM